MSDEIVVSVHSYGPDRALGLVYHDPASGRKRAKSSGTKDEREAERRAAVLQAQLNSGQFVAPSKLTWKQLRGRIESGKLAGMRKSTQNAYRSALNTFERLASPVKASQITAALMTRFQERARAEEMGVETLHHYLRHVKACLRWAERQGLLAKCPHIEMPKRTGGYRGKHRPLSGEEVEKMLLAVPRVRPHDAPTWQRLIWGLFLSGLRLSEAVALTWHDDDAPAGFTLDVTGPEPVFRIDGACQKSGKSETAAAAPDFGDWACDQTPEAERHGRVFPLLSPRTGLQLTEQKVGEIVASIGKRSGVVLGECQRTKRDKSGLVTRTTLKAHPTAHDLRRAFVTKWARRVPAPVLQRLARHSSITTTQMYYTHLRVEDIGTDLRAALGAMGGNSPALGNNRGNIAPATAAENGQENVRNVLQGNEL